MDPELEKIKYHIRHLAEALDWEEHPIAYLVVHLDWNEEDLDRAHDIFEKYDKLLSQGEQANYSELERDLKNEFGIDYQTVKTIVNAFYANGQWLSVCKWFVKGHGPAVPIEFKHIQNDTAHGEE
jgi:hypothetical protein